MHTFHELIHAYEDGAALLRRSVSGLSRDQVMARPIAERWTTLEVVAHLADFEPILANRMKRVLALERPLLLTADENLFAANLAYADRDLEEELAVIEATRSQMARVLKNVAAEAAHRVGVHSFKGLVTLEAVLQSAVNHIPHHVRFIDEKRAALGA